MAELVSALKGQLVVGRSGIPGQIGVCLSEIRPFTLIQIAAWPDTLKQTAAEAAKLVDTLAAPGPGRASVGTAGTLLRVEPLKWWLLGETIKARHVALAPGTVLDLTHSRAWLRVGGPRAERLLNHVLPLDLSVVAFPVGAVAATAFHHVGVTLWREAKCFHLFLPRSFAASLCEILTETAGQYGLEIT